MVDFFQSGQTRVQAFFDQDSILEHIWEGRSKQVVLIIIDVKFEDGDKERVQQSGYVMDEGRLILTVNHGFIIDDGIIQGIRSVDYRGRIHPLKLSSFQYDDKADPAIDWAILVPDKPLLYETYVRPSPAQVSDKLLIIGYPGEMGVKKSGEVIRIGEYSLDHTFALALICKISVLDQHALFPEAGTIPVSGISGSPVFDGGGNFVGLFSSMSRRRYLSGWQTIFHMAEVPLATIDSLSSK